MVLERYDKGNMVLKRVRQPKAEILEPVPLSDFTMEERRKNLLRAMEEEQIDCLIIYGDLEHGSNFEYLTGFLPRFEEALLVIHRGDTAFLLLGNENLKMASYSRIPARAVHVPAFSLPNQPMDRGLSIRDGLLKARAAEAKRIGVVGWKLLEERCTGQDELFDVPYYIIAALKNLAGAGTRIINKTGIFIHPGHGIRTVNNCNEIAHYEFGSALSGNCVLDGMNQVGPGKSEMEIGSSLKIWGQPNSVVTISAAGERFQDASLYPGRKRVRIGDKLSLTTGFKGGLTSRAGYAVSCKEELPETSRDYLERVAAPYYAAMAAWLEQVKIGMKGGELYQLIETVLPKEEYGWSLNPGHLTADEEWLSSPIWKDSGQLLKSGMLLQADIIPSVPGYGGAGAESGIALADEDMRNQLKECYPKMWKRVGDRRKYMKEELGIILHQEVLPLSCLTGYYRPFMLDRERAFTVVR